ncbi:MAG: peptidase M48, partial [Salinibacter sp.]
MTGNTRLYAYTWAEERKLGRRAADQIRRKYGVYEDKALQAYVDEVGRAVLAKSDLRRPSTREKFREAEFHFRVLDSPAVNA